MKVVSVTPAAEMGSPNTWDESSCSATVPALVFFYQQAERSHTEDWLNGMSAWTVNDWLYEDIVAALRQHGPALLTEQFLLAVIAQVEHERFDGDDLIAASEDDASLAAWLPPASNASQTRVCFCSRLPTALGTAKPPTLIPYMYVSNFFFLHKQKLKKVLSHVLASATGIAAPSAVPQGSLALAGAGTQHATHVSSVAKSLGVLNVSPSTHKSTAATAAANARLESALATNTVVALDSALAVAHQIESDAVDDTLAGLIARASSALAVLNGKASVASSRVMDVAAECGDNMNPIVGLYGAPVLSFAKCMEHTALNLDRPDLNGPALRVHITSAQYFAENLVLRSRSEGRDEPLSEDQICAIYIYTANSPFYGILNKLLRDKRRDGVKPFAPYLRLLISALHVLPASKMHVYRGVKSNLAVDYIKGTTVVWWAISSTTSSLGVLQSPLFLGEAGQRTMFNIDTRYAVDIHRYSAITSESEVAF